MIPVNVALQSAGSLSVAVIALMMMILEMVFYFRNPKFRWFAWSAAISFSGMVYAIGIFFEYNTLGSANRFAGLLEFTAIIFLVHCLYGFTFSYLGKNSKRYHIIAGFFHCLILIFLWYSGYIVADRFISRDFIWLTKPFIESDIGPIGPVFELYAAMSCTGAIIFWLKNKGPNTRHTASFLIGIIFWLALGIHDGLASMGVPTLQYFMEYGFLGFSLVILWVVFGNFIDMSAEDKYRIITEYANDGILGIQGGEIVFANPACNRLAGCLKADSPVADILDYVAREDIPRLTAYYNNILYSFSFQDPLVVRINNTPEDKIVEVRGSIIIYRGRPAFLAVIRDITQRALEEKALKDNEEKILRLKKMESLGLLAGGVAHDLNNVLSGIVGYPELILLDLPEDSKLSKPIRTMQESGLKAVAIVQDLLTMVRGVAIKKEPLNLNEVIKKYLKTPEYAKLIQYHPAVTIKDKLASDLLIIKGSALHIGKIVMNLVSNACEAVNGSGSIIISTENRYLDRPLKRYNDMKTGEYAVLTVEDNGSGISPDDLERIFEPFFTKKVMGRSGTGLGLTVVWNSMRDHDGYIDVTSGNGGTKFELYFPATGESIPCRDLIVPMENLYGNGEMLLIIDDVDSQREILCQMLETLKYKTKSVSSGEGAVDYLKTNNADLLLLDMIMDPGINGRDTYEKISKIHPGQKAIIVSGFTETEDVKQTLDMGAGRFLKKPLLLEELGLAVKKELGK